MGFFSDIGNFIGNLASDAENVITAPLRAVVTVGEDVVQGKGILTGLKNGIAVGVTAPIANQIGQVNDLSFGNLTKLPIVGGQIGTQTLIAHGDASEGQLQNALAVDAIGGAAAVGGAALGGAFGAVGGISLPAGITASGIVGVASQLQNALAPKTAATGNKTSGQGTAASAPAAVTSDSTSTYLILGGAAVLIYIMVKK